MKFKKFIKISFIISLVTLVLVISAIAIYCINVIKPIKNMDISLNNNELNYSTLIDKNGIEVSLKDYDNTNYINISSINDYTINAFISIEDKNFYKHKGLNCGRIIKACLNNIKSGRIKEGASTITQQLVKNRFLTNEKSINRKIKEAYLSLKLEKKENKAKIMETYLNTIYYGNGAYGIGNASQIFFSKNPNELTLSESCLLAGVIKSPYNYSPINNIDNCIRRRNLVLSQMLEDKYITEDQYNKAISDTIVLNENIKILNNDYDLYTENVINEASKILNTTKYNIIHGGFKIYTYQDAEIQRDLNKVINDEKYYIENSYGNIPDSLSIIIDNETLGVSAIAGKSQHSLVDIKRQPGSLIKPVLVYSPALEERLINSQTQILDEKINYDGYSPNNVGNKFYGYVSVKDAVAKSLNIPPIKLCKQLGIDKCKDYASKVGIDFNNNDNGYAIVLGGLTEGTTLKSITDSYIPYVKDGNYCESKFISKINYSNNLTLYNRLMSTTHIYKTSTSYIMTDMLKYSVDNGTSRKLSKFDYDTAGKTGTVAVKGTNYNTDAYSLAYTTNHIMSVWLGNYSYEKEFNLEGNNNGGTYATQIIADTFDSIYKDTPPPKFPVPNDVIKLNIDSKSLNDDHIVVLGNNIPSKYQIEEYFAIDNQPTQVSTKFNSINFNKFEIKANKNSCSIILDTVDYQKYNIYRIYNGKNKLIKTIKNHNGDYTFIDDDIIYNNNMTYYIEVESIYSDAKYISNQIDIIVNKDYNQIIQNQEEVGISDLSWLFA